MQCSGLWLISGMACLFENCLINLENQVLRISDCAGKPSEDRGLRLRQRLSRFDAFLAPA
jgi:hypothetical protein